MPISIVRGDAEVLRGVTAFLRQLADLRDAAIADFAAAAKMRVLEPGASFCDQGQTVHELGYVQSGIVRYFVTLPDGNEATKDFSFVGGFTLSFGSAVMQRPGALMLGP